MVFLFVPEVLRSSHRTLASPTYCSSQTTFNREEAIYLSNKSTSPEGSGEKSVSDADVESVDRSTQIAAPSYISQLRVWHGTFTDESIFKIFLRPFPFLLSPIVRAQTSSRSNG